LAAELRKTESVSKMLLKYWAPKPELTNG